MPVTPSSPQGAISDSLCGSVQSREGIFLSERRGRQRSQGEHRCPIPQPCALPRPRPALLTQFPPDRLSMPVSHPTSCLLSSSATPLSAPRLLLPWHARQHHLRGQRRLSKHTSSSYLSPSPPFPIPHLLLPTFFHLPCPSPCFRISSRCSPSALAPHHTLRASPPRPHSSPDPLLHSAFLLARSHRDPTGALQPPGPGAVSKHSLQGQDLFRICGKHLKRLCCAYTVSHAYNKAKVGATYAVVAKAHFWLKVLPFKTPPPELCSEDLR